MKRSAPLRRRSLRRRRPVPAAERCSFTRCRKRSRYEGLCLTHAILVADMLCADRVKSRDGWACTLCGSREQVEWAHIIRRWKSRATRWHLDGAVTLCHSCHQHYNEHENEWRALIEARFPGRWERLERMALSGARPDVSSTIQALRREGAA